MWAAPGDERHAGGDHYHQPCSYASLPTVYSTRSSIHRWAGGDDDCLMIMTSMTRYHNGHLYSCSIALSSV
jgi:hypothetical protein